MVTNATIVLPVPTSPRSILFICLALFISHIISSIAFLCVGDSSNGSVETTFSVTEPSSMNLLRLSQEVSSLASLNANILSTQLLTASLSSAIIASFSVSGACIFLYTSEKGMSENFLSVSLLTIHSTVTFSAAFFTIPLNTD